MGKRWRTWSIGLTCLTALAPWAVSSTPDASVPAIVLPKIFEGPCPDRPAVRLDFVDEPAKCAVCPTIQDAPLTRTEARLPIELPGANSPPAVFPKFDPNHAAEFAETIDKLYPPLPPTGMVMPPLQGPEGRPMTLDDLQHYAEASSPLLRQAAADTVSYSHAGFCNLQAILFARHRHAQAVAAADHELARLTQTRIEAEVLAGVRRGYFAVLAAQESMRTLEAFAKFSDDAYRQHVERVKAGHASSAEPLQLRTLAYQARANLVQSRNRYLSAWKQLAATVGRLDLQPALLDGQIDRPLPIMSFEKLHACVLSRNSEVAAAQYELQRAQSVLRAYTATPLAIFHRAAAARAKAAVARTQEEPEIVRAVLTSELADAFERYDNHRRILAYYRDSIVPDQVRAYRGVTSRPSQERAIVETVVAQQALAHSVATYLHSLGEAWFAVVDIGRLVQSRDLFTGGDATCGSQLACLGELPSCRAGPAAMNWPDVIPSHDEPPVVIPRIIPGVTCGPCAAGQNPTTAPAPTCADCRPVTGSLVAPVANTEKNTKRRRFFTFPPMRRETETPLTLPQEETSTAPCLPKAESPPSVVIPKSLPQPATESSPPIKLPELPAKQLQSSEPKQIRLPQIIEGPIESKKPATRAETAKPQIIVPVAATQPAPKVQPEIIRPAAEARPTTMQRLPEIINGPTPILLPVPPRAHVETAPPPMPAPSETYPESVPAIAPPLRLPAWQ